MNNKKGVLLPILLSLSGNAISSNECEKSYEIASDQLKEFIDRNVGLDVFLDTKKIINKYSLKSGRCYSENWTEGFSGYRWVKRTRKGFCSRDLHYDRTYGGNYAKGVFSVDQYHIGVNIGKILDEVYSYTDIKNALKREGVTNGKFSLDGTKFKIDITIKRTSEDYSGNKPSYAIVNLTNMNKDFAKCLSDAAEQESIKRKGKDLKIN